MKKKLLANWGIKLISLLTAFGLWFAVMYIDDPFGEETFTNIQVQFLNTHRLTDEGKVYEVLDNTDLVKQVRVKGPRKVLAEMKKLGNGAITATADFEDMNMSGIIDIQFEPVTQYASSITDIKPSSGSTQLKLFVEDKVEKSISVDVIITGEVAEDHQIGTKKADQNRIKITGGESKVAQVSFAAVTVDVTGSDSDISTTETIRLYDQNGEMLDNNIVQKNINSTKANVTVLGTKTVPIEYSVSGEVMDGYRITEDMIESGKGEIKLAGTDSALSYVNSIVIPSGVLDMTERTEDLVQEINLRNYLPTGVQIAKDEEESKVTIRVGVEEVLKRTYKMLSGNIQVINVPDGFEVQTAEAHEIYDVNVEGLNGELNLIQESTLAGVVDVAAWMEAEDINTLKEGTYYIPAVISLPDGVNLSQPTEIEVTFTADENEE